MQVWETEVGDNSFQLSGLQGCCSQIQIYCCLVGTCFSGMFASPPLCEQSTPSLWFSVMTCPFSPVSHRPGKQLPPPVPQQQPCHLQLRRAAPSSSLCTSSSRLFWVHFDASCSSPTTPICPPTLVRVTRTTVPPMPLSCLRCLLSDAHSRCAWPALCYSQGQAFQVQFAGNPWKS